MKVQFGNNATLLFSGGIQTAAGSNIITKNGTVVLRGGMQTAGGTSMFTASSSAFDTAATTNTGIKGFRAALNFACNGLLTNTTTYASIGGGAGNQSTLDSYYNVGTGTSAYGYVPFRGSVIGFGARCKSPRTAGWCTVTVMNGGTILTSGTFNSTNTKVYNGALVASGSLSFAPNNVRVRVKTSTAWAPTATNPISGFVWVEV